MSPNLTVAQPRMATCEGTGAELVCQALLAAGVDVLFGVPGDTGVALYDALRSSAELRHVLMNDERGAVFAADAYARCTNRPGVVEVSSGGGATFCIGGLGEALAAAIPMVVISSDIQTSSRGSGALTETDQLGLFAAVTKWRGVAQTAADLPRLIAEAFENAMHGRPGPAVIIVPENVLDERASVRAQCATTLDGPRRVRAHEDNIRQIAEALATAERPVIIAGGGVHLSQAYREIEELAVLTGAAVGTSIHGKGAIAETHPLSLGVIGANGGRDYATDFVSEADFALLVGTRANSTDTDGFRAPPRDAVIAVVDIDLDSRAIHNYPNAYVATGDAATVLAQLVKALPRRAPRSNEILEHHLATLARDWRTRVDLRTSKPPLLAPWQVMERVHAALPSNATVVADCGTPTPYLGPLAGGHGRTQCRHPSRPRADGLCPAGLARSSRSTPCRSRAHLHHRRKSSDGSRRPRDGCPKQHPGHRRALQQRFTRLD